jgi:hypothetical protein
LSKSQPSSWAGASPQGYHIATAMLRLEERLDDAAAIVGDALARFPEETSPWTEAALLAQAPR